MDGESILQLLRIFQVYMLYYYFIRPFIRRKERKK